MRMHASWFGSQRPTGYKVAARTPRAATASSPRTRHPDHTERAAVLGSIKARPGNDGACGQRRAMADLDSPCARRPPTHVGRGEETGFQVEQRNWYQGSGECREIVLDFESPIQGRDVELQGQPGWPDRPRGHQDPQDSASRSQERSTVPDDPAESEKLRWRLADRGPRLQERARFPRL